MLETKILSPQERRQRNRDEMTTAILSAAREMMRRDGVGALNLHTLARQVGLSTSSLYVYFPSKMAIYDALYALGVRMYLEEIQAAIQNLNDPWEILQTIMEKHMSLSIQNPELFQIVFERPIPGFEPSETSLLETQKMIEGVFDVFSRIIPEAEYDFEHYIPASHGLILAMIHGLTAVHLANDPGLPAGSGRIGSLIPAAVDLFKSAWEGAATRPALPVDQAQMVGRSHST